MKKWLFLPLLLLLLTGCSPDTGLKPPPRLTVTLQEQTYKKAAGDYSWDCISDGTSEIADGIHPLDGKDYLTPLVTEGATATLSFWDPPDRLSVQCWSDAHWGNTDVASQPVTLEGNTLPLRQGGYLYYVSAGWERKDYRGTANYILYVISTAEDAVLLQPPVLTVTAGDVSLEAVRGTYTWSTPLDGETTQSVCADSPGPEELLKDTPPTAVTGAEVTLQFATPPESVTVTPGALNGNTLTLTEGKQIYSVHATWPQGDAWYCFTVEK